MTSRNSFFQNWEDKGYDYVAAARKKATRTREAKRKAKEARAEMERKRRDEEIAAQDWYEERRKREEEWSAFLAARQRQDHLLPDEDSDMPF